jgi:transcriptional regulator with XRE-family HTH domain
MENINKHISSKIFELRSQAKISQSELGRQLGEKPNTISRWEAGMYAPNIQDLYRVSNFFSVPISHFLPEGKIDLKNEIRLLLEGSNCLTERDEEEIKSFIEFKINSKNTFPRLRPGRKRKLREVES